jgi:hypothetical protein
MKFKYEARSRSYIEPTDKNQGLKCKTYELMTGVVNDASIAMADRA